MNFSISQLYERYSDSLYRFGIGMGISHDACLDIIHDVFCTLIEKNIVLETNSVKNYLFRCFINRHINIKKSKKNTIPVDVSDLPFILEISWDNTTSEGVIIEKEEKEQLKRQVEFLLSLLTERQRKAVFLRYFEEMEYEDISKLMDMKVESVRILVFRAIDKLRKHAGGISSLYSFSGIILKLND